MSNHPSSDRSDPGDPSDHSEPAEATESTQPAEAIDTSETPKAVLPHMVGVGASAGGLEALRTFFAEMPVDSGLTFIVIQHLAPNHKSLMVELLQRATRIPVQRAAQDMLAEPNQIYLIPPGYNLTLVNKRFQLTPGPKGRTLNLPIDICFRSLAADCGEHAIAVILSGTGSDGARGIRAIKEAGGMIMVQAEASAKFAGMPTSAIATGAADFVLPAEEMPAQLLKFISHPFADGSRVAAPTLLLDNSSHFENIIRRLREVTGIDFSLYKQATFARRIERRMHILQANQLQEYIKALYESRSEALSLGKDLLISVTKFFRDSEAFTSLNQQLAELFAAMQDGECLRIWVAACATGEEAYSLAILCEELRVHQFPRINYKVFATDVDRDALECAGSGIYPRSVVADLPPHLLEQYFQPDGAENFKVSRTIRDRLIFASQDLLSDPPFTRIHLVSCRNLMIYLRIEAQRKLLSQFHFSLLPGGLLFLGGSETLGELSYAFDMLDSKHRIYRKSADKPLKAGDAKPYLSENPEWLNSSQERPHQPLRNSAKPKPVELIQRHLLQQFAPATIVVNAACELLYTLGPVETYLKWQSGPSSLNVLKMVNRDLGLAISTAASQSLREKKQVEFRAIRLEPDVAAGATVRIQAEAFTVEANGEPLVLISFFDDVPLVQQKQDGQDFDQQQHLLERIRHLESDLLNTLENLQSSIEQQETANEELQAANEELLASNEELQSTNEELESVNEELYTVNAEYQGKIQELTEVNDDMANFARSTDIGTIFFDANLKIRRFTPLFARITELNENDNGRSLTTFAHPVFAAILQAAPAILREHRRLHEAIIPVHPHGTFLLRMIPYQVEHGEVQGVVASLVDVSQIVNAEAELKSILQTVNVGICVTDEAGRFVEVNQAYCRIYGYRSEELVGKHFSMVVPPDGREAARQLHDDFIETGVEMPAIWDVIDKAGEPRKIAVSASLLKRADGSRRKITVVTDFRDMLQMVQQAEAFEKPD